jgi:hypothetical protein
MQHGTSRIPAYLTRSPVRWALALTLIVLGLLLSLSPLQFRVTG